MRESRFELLRIIAIFYIVLYHLINILVFHCNYDLQQIRIPLHIGVICFVLISGYYHIKLSIRGIVKLLAPVICIVIPLDLLEGRVNYFLLSHYWFVRVYFYLMLVSPVLNIYLRDNYRRFYALIALGFIAIYMAWRGGDANMEDGKNVVLFSFLYVIGDIIRYNEGKLKKISTCFVLILFMLISVGSASLFEIFDGRSLHGLNIGTLLWRSSFPYSSPLLIANGFCLFIVFSRMTFQSKLINWVASSVFTIYLVQEHPYVLSRIVIPSVKTLSQTFHNNIAYLIMYLVIFTWLIMIFSIIIDKLIQPLCRFMTNKAAVLDNRWPIQEIIL